MYAKPSSEQLCLLVRRSPEHPMEKAIVPSMSILEVDEVINYPRHSPPDHLGDPLLTLQVKLCLAELRDERRHLAAVRRVNACNQARDTLGRFVAERIQAAENIVDWVGCPKGMRPIYKSPVPWKSPVEWELVRYNFACIGASPYSADDSTARPHVRHARKSKKGGVGG